MASFVSQCKISAYSRPAPRAALLLIFFQMCGSNWISGFIAVWANCIGDLGYGGNLRDLATEMAAGSVFLDLEAIIGQRNGCICLNVAQNNSWWRTYLPRFMSSRGRMRRRFSFIAKSSVWKPNVMQDCKINFVPSKLCSLNYSSSVFINEGFCVTRVRYDSIQNYIKPIVLQRF